MPTENSDMETSNFSVIAWILLTASTTTTAINNEEDDMW